MDSESVSFLGSAHHCVLSGGSLLRYTASPPHVSYSEPSHFHMFLDKLFLPIISPSLLLKIAKQMGKIEQSVKCEHSVLNSYLNEQFNSI